MTVQMVRLGRCLAAVDVLTGSGLLALPHPSEDLIDPVAGDGRRLSDAEVDAALLALDAIGVEPSPAEDGGLCRERPLPNGTPVVGLYVRDPVHPDADLRTIAEAFADLHAALCAVAGCDDVSQAR